MKLFQKPNALTVLLLSVGIWNGCSQQPLKPIGEGSPEPKVEKDRVIFPENAPQLAYLRTEAAQERKTVANKLSGRLAWNDDVTSRVFASVSGRISEILVNPGQSVAAGCILAKIKSADFGQAQAEARKAVADLKVAERVVNRNRELFAHGAAAQKEVDAAEADYSRAVSEKERAFATLAVYGMDANSETQTGVDGIFGLRAPVNGVVVEKTINPGQEVRSDQVGDRPLFVISDPTTLWLYLDVTETDAVAMRKDQEVQIYVRAIPDKVFHGRLQVIGEGLDPTTRTIKARCVVDNPEKTLRAEMYVTADVTANASGIDVSTKAIFSKDEQRFVFIESAPGQFQRREIKLGVESNGRSVILNGLAAGEKVVVEGSLLLQSLLEGENT